MEARQEVREAAAAEGLNLEPAMDAATRGRERRGGGELGCGGEERPPGRSDAERETGPLASGGEAWREVDVGGWGGSH